MKVPQLFNTIQNQKFLCSLQPSQKMTEEISPFKKCPSADVFTSVFTGRPEEICQGIQRCRAPRKRHLRFVRSISSNLSLATGDNSDSNSPLIHISGSTNSLFKM